MNTKLFTDALSALLGQFTPGNLGSRLFMERSELETPENFLVWFHERFHYRPYFSGCKVASCKISIFFLKQNSKGGRANDCAAAAPNYSRLKKDTKCFKIDSRLQRTLPI